METEPEKLESIPMTTCVEFVGISNSAGLKSKLFEFNEGVEEKQKLNANEKAHLERYYSAYTESYHYLKMTRLITSGLLISRNWTPSKRFCTGLRSSSFLYGTSSETTSSITKVKPSSAVLIVGWILSAHSARLLLMRRLHNPSQA